MRSPLIRSFSQLDSLDPCRPVVTLFSGGLDSSYLLLRLRRMGIREVHAVSVDIGEDESSTYKRQVAEALGATIHILDRRAEFADRYVAPAIAAQAVYLGIHPVSSTLSRPLIAQSAVGLARALGAQAVLHTANRSQNTLRRLNGALTLLGYEGAFGSPYDLDPVSRDDKLVELRAAGIDLLAGRIVSGDSNLWCREFESGILDDPELHEVPEEMYTWSRPTARPGDTDTLTVTFEHGLPVALDGEPLPLTGLVERLNRRVGAYGLGRYSGLEHLDHGEKVLEIREMPAAWLLLSSYRHIESACLGAELIREKRHLEQVWTREALEGRWFGELRLAAQVFIDACAARTTGSVAWRLRTGGADTRSIAVGSPLYLRDREQWEERAINAESAPFVPAAEAVLAAV
ncbi:argininosuccinate synthase [Streptomyces sp. Ag82_O1-12]|uniref:argininosuccinate synthase-related protein n=1 Tax=unclassified Streptomyces TaxID=2593676 RepID=UPI000BD5DBBF|nr:MULTISPECIES: argininosuccinate synthase-related protein [unclassified Streptomyces]SMQ15965.1 argininosuccinate synthase [Streptomyces sp. Ag82_O1-12]SOD44993.1 argininosuccinate synthase [Streptomyces sp. Ag82_G6-1]